MQCLWKYIGTWAFVDVSYLMADVEAKFFVYKCTEHQPKCCYWLMLTNIVSQMLIMACHLSVPSHYLNQSWNIVNLTLRNKLQLNFNPNSLTFNQDNAFKYVVCEMAAILSWLQCVNPWRAYPIHILSPNLVLTVPGYDLASFQYMLLNWATWWSSEYVY